MIFLNRFGLKKRDVENVLFQNLIKRGGRWIPRVERTFPGRCAGEVKTANRTTRASAVKFNYVFGEKIL